MSTGLNSRKLWVAVGTEVLNAALLIAGLLQADHFVTITITVIGAYMATQAWVDRGI